MQTSKDKLSAQQLVLFHLGFYKGLIDGIWSTATIAAKKKFEADMSFLPAYPNMGLPFGERDKLPKDMYYERGLIKHKGLTPEREKEILDAMKARMGNSAAKEAEPEVAEPAQGPEGQAGAPGPDYPGEGQDNPLAGQAGPDAQSGQKGNQQHGHKPRHQHGNQQQRR